MRDKWRAFLADMDPMLLAVAIFMFFFPDGRCRGGPTIVAFGQRWQDPALNLPATARCATYC